MLHNNYQEHLGNGTVLQVFRCSSICRHIHTLKSNDNHFVNMQYTAIFHCCKSANFQMKNSDIFLSFAQNKDCGYPLEYPQSMF